MPLWICAGLHRPTVPLGHSFQGRSASDPRVRDGTSKSLSPLTLKGFAVPRCHYPIIKGSTEFAGCAQPHPYTTPRIGYT